jgi:hypothetical protein
MFFPGYLPYRFSAKCILKEEKHGQWRPLQVVMYRSSIAERKGRLLLFPIRKTTSIFNIASSILALTFHFFQNDFMEENKKDIPKQQQNREAKQGNYKNIETSVNNPSSFDDDYAAKEEDKITEREHKTEKEGRVGRS